MVLYSQMDLSFQERKTVCNSVIWFTSYNNLRYTGEFRPFFKRLVEIFTSNLFLSFIAIALLVFYSSTKLCHTYSNVFLKIYTFELFSLVLTRSVFRVLIFSLIFFDSWTSRVNIIKRNASNTNFGFHPSQCCKERKTTEKYEFLVLYQNLVHHLNILSKCIFKQSIFRSH